MNCPNENCKKRLEESQLQRYGKCIEGICEYCGEQFITKIIIEG